MGRYSKRKAANLRNLRLGGRLPPAQPRPPPPQPPPLPVSPPPLPVSPPPPAANTSSVAPSTSPPPSTSAAPTPAVKHSLDIRRELMKNYLPTSLPDNTNHYIGCVESLQELLVEAVCRHCFSPFTLNISPNSLSTRLEVGCTSCTYVKQLGDRTTRTVGGQASKQRENNTKIVHEAINNNLGRAGINRIVSTLGFEPFTEGKFTRHSHWLYKEMDIYFAARRQECITGVRRFYAKSDILPDPTNYLLDIVVSYDGTWMTRGHTSHIGAGIVIEVDTGMVIDFEVLSNFCQVCHSREKKKLPFTPEWQQAHSPRCNKNFNGTASAMESEAACHLWRRSTTLGLRYTTFVGDGDSSTYKAVKDLNPYDVPVVKEECVNHVSKRLGTRLRKLKKELSTSITTKTGKEVRRSVLGGAGQLTDKVIDTMTSYYGRAVRGDPKKPYSDTNEMSAAIWASYLHAISTDEEPRHHFCPASADSWCFYRRAEFNPDEPRRKRRVNYALQMVALGHNLGFQDSYFLGHLGFGMSHSKSSNLVLQDKECARSFRRSSTGQQKRKRKEGRMKMHMVLVLSK
ncbi:hypothetical protein Pcinc_006343 [Petrolisthes cinctipes]|uniref:Mutator-like transposase domain-containing protein n=1 Tax=Petrolisthes cinctipes TaxID=88211 RepID=A0AAE1GBY8_PETCI|nr:hypothetical protein Pcinc_006343 [Petrolisthes cinctipes]